MHQIFAILAVVVAVVAGGSTVRLMDANSPFGVSHPAQAAPAPASRTTRRPMDAIPPFPSH